MQFFCSINISKAVEDTSDWVISNNGEKVYGDSITWKVSQHVGDDDKPRYRTIGYNMSRKAYTTSQKVTEGSNSQISKSFLSVSSESASLTDPNGDRYYEKSFSRKDFMEAACSIGVTADELIRNGPVTVYLNPIYEVYIGDRVLEGWTYVFGLQEMLSYGWSPQTQDKLPTLYNEEFQITDSNIYDIKVVAVDENQENLSGAFGTDKSVVPSSLYSGKLMAYQPFDGYTLPNKYSILNKNNTTYKYDHFDYEYTSRSPECPVSIQENSSKTICFDKSPDAKPATTLTIYMVYDKQAVEYTYTIDAVNLVHTKLRNIRPTPIATESGKKVSEPYGKPDMLDSITVGGKNYFYTKDWYLTYSKSDGSETVYDGPTDYIYMDKMPEAEAGSNAVFHLIYSAVSPTPTPPISGTPSPTPIVTEQPSPTPIAQPSPPIPPVITPNPEPPATLPFTSVVNTGVLRADLRGAERFVADLGVPTTESLYAQVTAKQYLLGYTFVKKVGIKNFVVKVTRNYILEWESATPDSAGGSKQAKETVPITQEITVPRAYGYWEIENLECYKIDNAVVSNYALPGGSITMYPNNAYYSPPFINVLHSANPDDHILAPAEVTTGIKLPDVIVMPPAGKETQKPNVPIEDFSYTALCETGNALVKNDYLAFNGSTVINNSVVETEAPGINTMVIPQRYDYINNNVLYKPDNRIEATKLNGVYPTFGTITYSAIAKIGSYKNDLLKYSIDGINNVVIHTPVVCSPTITADNDKYVQLINPNKNCVQLVLDPDQTLSDFTVHISNTGFHSGFQGYFTRDFSKSIYDPNVSYIAKENGLLMNQVKFPFDVYIDKGTAYVCSDDDFIKANTWITIDRSTPRFYLPMTVNEGIYTVNFRTIAVNGEPFLTNTEVYANTQRNNYVATDRINVEVSGRMYGLTVYDISDYPMWEEVFRVPKSMDLKKDDPRYSDGTASTIYNAGHYYTYSLGTNDQYGMDTGRDIKYTFPLVNGSHPQYKNQGILKTGYLFRFALETTGNMFSDACMISIKPNFYFVDKDGRNRKSVDLYYTEYFGKKTQRLVKVGSPLDQTNLKDYMTGDLNLSIPEVELKQTAALRGMKFSEFTSKYSAMFSFSDIRLNWAFRTYMNNDYLSKVKSYSSYNKVTADGITDGDILDRMQRWYGQYYLPNEVHAVAKGFDVMDYADKYGVDYDEDFWLTDGYIIVNFTIETVGEDGNRRLSYINYSNYRDNGNCSMWLTEGPIPSKVSYKGPTFTCYAGDIAIFYANKRMSDDYETGAVY